jgi:hypothetical protein
MSRTEKVLCAWSFVLTLAFGYLLYRRTTANDRWEKSMEKYESAATIDSVQIKIDEINKAIDKLNETLKGKP